MEKFISHSKELGTPPAGDLRARSPWSVCSQASEVTLSAPRAPIDISVTIPGSKSITNRAVLLSGFAGGLSDLRGVLKSDDSYWAIESLRRLGVDVTTSDAVLDESVRIARKHGQKFDSGDLYLGASGTLARFLPGLLAAQEEGKWHLSGGGRLHSRPASGVIDALRSLGAHITCLEKEGFYPLAIEGTGLCGGDVKISGAQSSQFVSGLLMAAPLAREAVRISVVGGIVQQSYVFITVDLMRKFGAHVDHDAGMTKFEIQPTGYLGSKLTLEADASSACYPLAFAALSGGKARITNLGQETLQPDFEFVEILRRMGCEVDRGQSFVEVRGPQKLKGGFTVDMRALSDQAVTVGCLAPFCDAPITVTSVEHIRHHECDRIAVVCAELRAAGVQVEERADGFTVHPGSPVLPSINSNDDHRIAMAFALWSAKISGIKISDPGCVSKTYPGYFDDMHKMGVGVVFK